MPNQTATLPPAGADLSHLPSSPLLVLTLVTSPAGVGLSHLTGAVRQMMKKITSVDQDNYPEMLGKTCIINAPGAFKMIWSGVQGMIEPRTRAKIEVGADATLRPVFLGLLGCP